jgi:2-polyprenyl-3-methyl-5-hydroxy-6-metoxy-1,4-benzoquinol methylase
MHLRDRWEAQASQWIGWARRPGHDSYWRFHRDQFLALLPAPGRCTVDIGCGEGRLTGDLKARGHHVMGIDASPSLVHRRRRLGSRPPVGRASRSFCTCGPGAGEHGSA